MRYRLFCLLALLLLFPAPAPAGEPGDGSVLSLPWDLSPGREPNPAAYSESAYEDASISVRLETREENGVIWHLAFVEIASPTQLRTWTANPENLLSGRTAAVTRMAAAAHAVVAINGDYYASEPLKAAVEYRMGTKIRQRAWRQKDVLLIDSAGDFHFLLAAEKQTVAEQGELLTRAFDTWEIKNAFCFGPALVIDGAAQVINPRYDYTPNRKDPRSALGQLGPLRYVLALAEGRGESSGATMQELADFMAALGCVSAYNLDGGNSSQLVFGDQVFRGQPGARDRGLSDIVYFASAVPEEEWK